MNRSPLRLAPNRIPGGLANTRQFVHVALLTLVAGCLANYPAHAVTIDMVTVGDAGNAAAFTGYGAVAYEYRIGKYETTIGQYAEYLNAVAKDDPHNLFYNVNWANYKDVAGIVRTGDPGDYSYSVIGPYGVTPAGASSPGNRPIGNITWFQAARFANWLHNGQGSGGTETGAYTLVEFQTSGTAPAKNAGAQFYIPTENEWYKAAYYKGGGLNSGYWTYPTRSDQDPGNTIGGSNDANTRDASGARAVTQSNTIDSDQNYLTEVGAFTNSYGPYGTFDQGGNLSEWTDLSGEAGVDRGVRGYYWNGFPWWLALYNRESDMPAGSESSKMGFRLASPVAVPEPSAYAMALAGVACGGFSMWRRRKRA